MDRNNGLEAKISKEETRTTITMGSAEIFPLPTRFSLQDSTLHMGITIRIREDHMTKDQISHSKEATVPDLEMNLSTIRKEAGETMEDSLVLHRPKGETSHKTFHTANQEVIGLTTLPSADLTIDLRLVSRLMNKSFRKTIIRHHLLWFASPQPTIPLTNCRIFARQTTKFSQFELR